MAFMDLVHDEAEEIYDGFPGQALVRAYEKLRFWLQSNSRRQARKNISYHYDLGNEFYGLWLDESMTYSSALFETGQESLERAQRQKYASMVDQMGAKPGRPCARDRLRLGWFRGICGGRAGAARHRVDDQQGAI
jgi:cyclopropane-fatty-acyl-phospholipid synthase